jgi:hypothetical protein
VDLLVCVGARAPIRQDESSGRNHHPCQ